MSRPYLGKHKIYPPEPLPARYIQGEKILWQELLPPYNLRRDLQRTIWIRRSIVLFLPISMLVYLMSTTLLPPLYGMVFAMAVIPLIFLFIGQFFKYMIAKESFEELQARYPLSAQTHFQEYFFITTKRIICRAGQNFCQTNPDYTRDIVSYEGDTFMGSLRSLASIKVLKCRSNKAVLSLTFSSSDLESLKEGKSNSPLDPIRRRNFLTSMAYFPFLDPNLSALDLDEDYEYPTMYNFTVTLRSPNVREIGYFLQKQAPQAILDI